jgi:ketosteroid isomerase-like protein
MMIGAILLKRAADGGYAEVNRHDVEAQLERYHEDAVFEFPGESVISGRHAGLAAIREFYEQWFEHMPETKFTIRHTAVEDIFALNATNNLYVEWEVDQTDREGQRYHATGVTRFRVEGGKIRHVKDYIFDQDVVAIAYPRKGDDVVESHSRTAQ